MILVFASSSTEAKTVPISGTVYFPSNDEQTIEQAKIYEGKYRLNLQAVKSKENYISFGLKT